MGIGGCKDDTEKGIYPFDDLILDMFKHRDDYDYLKSLHGYISINKKDYCLVHLLTLLNCCLGYMLTLKTN